jgi:hypothetical protein
MPVNKTKLEHLSIACLEAPSIQVHAMFNPKEVGVDRRVPWKPHNNPGGDMPMLEYTTGENRTMSLELLFDTAEDGTDVHQQYVSPLEQMTLIPEGTPSGKDRHPPRVKVVWGNRFPQFYGVIESFACKYTMFLPDGTPIRATCTVKLKEIDKAQMKAEWRRQMQREKAQRSYAR